VKFTKGLYQTGSVFLSWFAFLTSWAAFAKPQWGPLLGAAFGCFAFSIAVQQLYASSTEAKFRSEQFVYLWSSLTLFLFGIGTVFTSLPNITQIGLSMSATRFLFVASEVLFALGFITLFRFGAAYLYRDRTEVLSGNFFSVFRWKNPQVAQNNIELYHLLFCIIVAAVALFFYIDDSQALPPINAENPVYFPFPLARMALCISGIVTACCLAWFFRAKFHRIKTGGERAGISFMTAMGILFFFPAIMQITALVPWPDGFGFTPTIFGVLCIWFVIYLVLIAYASLAFANDGDSADEHVVANVRSVKRTIIGTFGLCLLLAFILLVTPSLLHIVPFGFITLGFLTLACAYLPINDLERLKLVQQQTSI
jgi:hypothetical protein